jgi:DNA-binding response OmpR family regulator
MRPPDRPSKVRHRHAPVHSGARWTINARHDERIVVIAESLTVYDVQVHCANTGRSGRRLLTSERFDLAIIEVTLPDASGIALATVAANENTPVLLISGRAKATARLKQYELADFPCLRKPLDLIQLRAETKRLIADSHQNIRRIKDAMTWWRANLAALEDVLADSGRLLDVSRQLCGESDRARTTRH